MRPFLRALPALLATLSLTLQPLAAQERYYFRNVSPAGSGITVTGPTGSDTKTFFMYSNNPDTGGGGG